ncbi:Multidrug ABC transporter substrate-binding protein [Sphingomonas antarctica]|uniref:ABC transporter permease n=1 Tax=Sphingomonas antarctica TaxID=2040274 RepID=UPI0039EA9DD3
MNLRQAIAGWMVNVATAVVALRTNLLRSILTALGVMIGVLAVVLAVAVGSGAQVSVESTISQLGSNMALVFPQPDVGTNGRSRDVGKLTERDAQAILRSVPGVTAIAPQLRASIQVSLPGRRVNTNGLAITPGYATVSNAEVDSGRMIADADVQSAARVIVLGQTVATKLFGDVDPVGESVRVNKVPFAVIGILAAKGSSFGNDNDDIALVPLRTGRQRFSSTLTGPDDLAVLFVGFDDSVDLNEAKSNIVRLMRARYSVARGEVQPFTVRTTEEFQKQSATVTGVFQAVLVAIASISLLVGGIGIMNIMLVSVTERTREIGLRMALGARRRDIRNQFLVEAASLCVIGGLLGLILAIIAARVFEQAADFPAPIGWPVAVGSIVFSAVIGLLFGTYPAIRASRLSPIEALRSE